MARNKFTFKKRQKELAKIKKKEEKMKRKLDKRKTKDQTDEDPLSTDASDALPDQIE